MEEKFGIETKSNVDSHFMPIYRIYISFVMKQGPCMADD
jgi:hypothetical protein